MANYKYYVVEHGDASSAYDFKCHLDEFDEMNHVAEMAADDFYWEHDGRECDWPLTFAVLNQEGKELGEFSVDMEFCPEFSARLV